MRRGRSTGKPTREQERRFESIKEFGCVACLMAGRGQVWPEIHHLLNTGRHGGKRLGHDHSVGLCPWHHRGIPFEDMNTETSEALAGPSLKWRARKFRETFGEDGALLAYQNKLLGIE